MRALAVVAVMVYHANHDWLPGGFLGVEVFFVISGYLITLLFIGEHEQTGTSAFVASGLRRARRLLPALFFMLLLVITYTAIFERESSASSAVTSSAGSATCRTGTRSGSVRVHRGGRLAPLRHLWSLAVEEQFYLFWPIVMGC